MTTETPEDRGKPLFTVADLRRWESLMLSNPNTSRYPCYGHSDATRGIAAALRALADGIEYCSRGRSYHPDDDFVAHAIGRILRREKP